MKTITRAEVEGGQQFYHGGRWYTAIEPTYEKIAVKLKWTTDGKGLWHVTDTGFVMWLESTQQVQIADPVVA